MAKKISLLPKTHEARLKTEVKKTLVLFLSLIAISFFIFFWLVILGYSQSHENDLKDIENKISVLEAQTESLKDVETQAQIIEAKLSGLGFLFENRIYWSEFFGELEKITLKKVLYDNLTANASGKVIFSGVAGSYEELAKLIFSLRSSPKIEKVDLNSAKWQSKEGIVGVRFNIAATLKENALIK